MARTKHKLTASVVKSKKQPGLYADGDGLYLQVTLGVDEKPRRSWIVRFTVPGRRPREMGLGSFEHVDLARAREKASDARDLAREGVDPIEYRDAERKRAAKEAAKAITFEAAASRYIETHQGSWKNPKHRQQWTNTLKTYAYPVFGDVPVQAIDTTLVLKVLEPLWKQKTETATRLRGRIETVLDWAKVRGYRTGENPAAWRGNLQYTLPPPTRLKKVKHHPALPYALLPAFMKQLGKDTSLSARALELVILTGVRTNEALMATWDEVDLVKGVWTIPADRMKGGKEHRVPLAPNAHRILMDLDNIENGDSKWVFSAIGGKHLSSMALLMQLRRMGKGDITVHGFRSTFRDWAAEETIHAREVAEAALAHISADKVERAYQRGDFFEKRKLLMEEWDRYAYGKALANKATRRPKHTKIAKKASAGGD